MKVVFLIIIIVSLTAVVFSHPPHIVFDAGLKSNGVLKLDGSVKVVTDWSRVTRPHAQPMIIYD